MFKERFFRHAFIIDVDFTIDLKIGFQPDVLFNFLKDQNLKTYRSGRYCTKTNVEIEQVDDNPENTGITVEVKYYNKFMYFCIVGGEITSCIGN